ncbi:MAG: efflux RND transporter periplasmic adaptor subunit [Brumimicrobium sp.]|nr:efflux RND transporter periplasmic adaptor subunit [Brumimicrobium sp.]
MKNKLYLSLLILVVACQSEEKLPQKEGDLDFTGVDYFITQAETIEQIISIPGNTLPFEQVMVFSEVSGRVKKIYFEEGEIVNKGKLLLEMDTEILEAQKKQYEVELDLAQKERKRKKNLYESQAGTLEAYEQALSKEESLRAQIDYLNVQIRKAKIFAPFEGKIGLRLVSEGAYLTPNDQITTLAQISDLKVSFSIAQRYAHKVRMGQKIHVTPPSDSLKINTIEGTVYATESSIDQRTQMLTVRAKLKNKGNIIPGGFVAVEYNLGEEPNSIKVPSTAVTPVIDGQMIWKFQKGKAEKVKVNLGVRSSEYVQVFGNIKPGDTVVMTGLLGMEQGKNIKPKNRVQ